MVRLVVALLSLPVASVLAQITNLPTVPPGVFNVSTRIEIATTTDAIWDALTDFPKYPNWNPFVRKAVVVDIFNISLPEQYPVEGANLFFRTQIPPLPLPVTASSQENLLNTQFSLENITHVQPELLRLAWKAVSPAIILGAERWQAISDLGNGKALYESCEVFSGPLAYAVKALYGESLQKGFDAQGQALKLLLE